MRAAEFSKDITLSQLYSDGLPDRDELFWEYVGSMDLDTPLEVRTMPKQTVMILLLSQYRVEHIDELTSRLNGERRRILQGYMKNPNLSNEVIVICDGRILDGNHRALAAALKGVSIQYVNLSDLESEEIDETVNDKLFWTGYDKKKPILDGQYVLVASAGYVGYGAKPDFKSKQFRIVAKSAKTGGEIGWVNFEINDNGFGPQNRKLEALDLVIQPEHRRRGIATEMYRFARELGNDIKPSTLQTSMGKKFWAKKDHSKEVAEEIIDEMPLPADWDATQYSPTVSYKQRLAYALERAKKIGSGSSRVAMTIEYQGRQTVLKVAKNKKGMAQNAVEAETLSDGYASQLGILIPIIDYDTQNPEPTWVHTELAQKATEKQLCAIMKCRNLQELVNLAHGITGKKSWYTYNGQVENMRIRGASEEDIETATEYANTLADLNNSFEIELGDFSRKANWGLYHGKPVILDVGFNSNVLQKHYSE